VIFEVAAKVLMAMFVVLAIFKRMDVKRGLGVVLLARGT